MNFRKRENRELGTRSVLGIGEDLQSVLVSAADLTNSGMVALTVLYEPSTSISITDLNAFGLS